MTVTPTVSQPVEVAKAPLPRFNSIWRQRWDKIRLGCVALIDQSFVSGSRFATSIIIGRSCGQEELGVYTMGFGLLVMATCVQESLITSPYTIFQARRFGSSWKQYNASVAVHYLAYALVSSLAFGLAYLFTRGHVTTGLPSVFLAMSVATPFALGRECIRRVEFARLRLGIATLVDASVAIVQVSLLLAVASSGQLTAGRAFTIVAVAAGVNCLVWIGLNRSIFRLARYDIWPEFKQAWRIGRWVFLALLTGIVHLQGMFWFVAAVRGTAETGVLAACTTLVLFINPFALGLVNLVSPMAVHALHNHGMNGVRHLVGKAMLLVSGCVLLFSIGLYIAGDRLLLLLFDDPSFAGHELLILLLGLNATLNTANMVCDAGLWALEKPHVVFWSTLLTVAVTFTLAVATVSAGGLVAAATSLIAGRLAGLLVESWTFFGTASTTTRLQVAFTAE